MEPEGEMYECDEDIVEAFRTLKPFVGNDASRPWGNGIIIRSGYAYATNNVVLSCYTKRLNFPFDTVIPKACVDELIRIKEEVLSIQATAKTITFHFGGDKWLRSNLISEQAPDFTPIFQKCSYNTAKMPAVPDDLAERVERLKPFTDPKIPILIFRKDGIFTSEMEDGACDSEYSFPLAIFRYEPVFQVTQTATHWNLDDYPGPCPFVGENISGVIIGMKGNAS